MHFCQLFYRFWSGIPPSSFFKSFFCSILLKHLLQWQASIQFFNCSKNAFSEKKGPIFLNVLLQSLQARVMIVLDKNNSTMKDRKVGLYLFDHVIKIITKSAKECERRSPIARGVRHTTLHNFWLKFRVLLLI